MANNVTISGTPLSSSIPADPDLCRVSGFIRNILGSTLRHEEITIRHLYAPLTISSDTLVLNERQVVRTDANGFIEFDLFQGARVQIEIPNRVVDFVKEVTVPERTGIDLVALVFPYLESVAFDNDDPILVVAGQRFRVTLTGTLSDGTEVDVTAGATLVVDDENIVSDAEGSFFTGLSVGTTTIDAAEIDTSALIFDQEPDGDTVERLDEVVVTLPTPITVTVS